MTLPPIVTNSPLFKAITGTQDKKTAMPDAGDAPAQKTSSQDSVDLSAEARELQTDELKSDDSARETAKHISGALANDQNLSLSKDGQGLSET